MGAEIIQIPENNGGGGNIGMNGIPFSIPIGGNCGGGLFGNNNNGMNSIAELVGLGIVASIFGWNGNGNGFGGNRGGDCGCGCGDGGASAAAAFAMMASQLSSGTGRELVTSTITS